MTKDLVERLQERFTLRRIELGADAEQKIGPMCFQLQQFEVQDVGNLAVMTGSAMLSLMRMDTFILTPLWKDAPLLSYDRVRAFCNDTLICELYETRINTQDQTCLQPMEQCKELLADVPAHDLGTHWYDSIKLPPSVSSKGRGCAAKYHDYMNAFLDAYMDLLNTSSTVDAHEKRERTLTYVNGLLEHGGPSTDAFAKAIGAERTERLFHSVLFGVDAYTDKTNGNA